MNSKVLVFICFMVTLCSCKRDHDSYVEPKWLGAPIDIVFKVDGNGGAMQKSKQWQQNSQNEIISSTGVEFELSANDNYVLQTKANDPEVVVKNLNIFFVYNHKQGDRQGVLHNKVARHIYINVPPVDGIPQDVTIKDMYAGKYKLFVLANYNFIGDGQGSVCVDQIVNGNFDIQEHTNCLMDYDKLMSFISTPYPSLLYTNVERFGTPMASIDNDFYIEYKTAEEGALKFDLNLTRLVSKYNLNYDLSRVNDGLYMYEVMVVNGPKFMTPFETLTTGVGENVLDLVTADNRPGSITSKIKFENAINGGVVTYSLPNPQTKPFYATAVLYHARKNVGPNYSDYWFPVELTGYNSKVSQNYIVNAVMHSNYLDYPGLIEFGVQPSELSFYFSNGTEVTDDQALASSQIYTELIVKRSSNATKDIRTVISTNAAYNSNMEISIYQVDKDNNTRLLLKNVENATRVEYNGDLESDWPDGTVHLRYYYKQGAPSSSEVGSKNTITIIVENGTIPGNRIFFDRIKNIAFV